jgi:hypothetical protein
VPGPVDAALSASGSARNSDTPGAAPAAGMPVPNARAGAARLCPRSGAQPFDDRGVGMARPSDTRALADSTALTA